MSFLGHLSRLVTGDNIYEYLYKIMEKQVKLQENRDQPLISDNNKPS